jgi:hypothetical protein
MKIQVETYSGYKADERPQAFYLGNQKLGVMEISDQWYDPHAMFFKVLASDGQMYILRHDQDPQEGAWTLEAYRRVEP